MNYDLIVLPYHCRHNFTLFLMRDRAGSPNMRDTQTMYIGRGNLDISEDLKYGKTWAGSNIPLNNNSPKWYKLVRAIGQT